MSLSGYLKGIKSISLKSMAVFLGICYLLGPLHSEIHTLVHSIVHCLEAPYEFIPHHYNSQLHNQHEQYATDISHQHEFIDLLDKMLSSTTKGEQPGTPIPVLAELDKHLIQFCINIPTFFEEQPLKFLPYVIPGPALNITRSLLRPPISGY